jgi:hypothetical protein
VERLTNKDLRALLEFIKECYPICDTETFAQRVVSRLSKIVPTENVSHNLVHPPRERNARVPSEDPARRPLGYACLMVRAVAEYREMVCDVLGEPWDASRGDPPNGVSTRGQRPHEQVVALLSARTEDQFGHHDFVKSRQIARR